MLGSRICLQHHFSHNIVNRTIEADEAPHTVEQWFSTFFPPYGTLSQQYHYLAAPLDAKIGQKVNKK